MDFTGLSVLALERLGVASFENQTGRLPFVLLLELTGGLHLPSGCDKR